VKVSEKVAELERENVRLREERDCPIALHVKLDGSTFFARPLADSSGGPMRTYRRAVLHPIRAYGFNDDPIASVPYNNEQYRLVAPYKVAGKYFVYEQVD
jgi:hypothetical protein